MRVNVLETLNEFRVCTATQSQEDANRDGCGANSEPLATGSVRYYSSMPAMTVYLADDRLFVGYFWQHRQATAGPYIELNPKGYLGRSVLDHFNAAWGSAKNRI